MGYSQVRIFGILNNLPHCLNYCHIGNIRHNEKERPVINTLLLFFVFGSGLRGVLKAVKTALTA